MSPRLFALAALAGLAGAAACGPRQTQAGQERRQILEGLTLSQSERGRPAWSLRAPRAVLREDKSLAELERPSMDFYRGGRVASRVTSLSGIVQTETHDVRLTQDVVLDSLEDRSRLTTQELLYSSKTGRFHTDAQVVVRRPEGTTTGRGLDAAPDLSEVRIYEQRTVLSGKPR